MITLKMLASNSESGAAYRDSDGDISGQKAKVQLVDVLPALGVSVNYADTPTRTVSSNDAADQQTVAAVILDNALSVSDGNVLCVRCIYAASNATGFVSVTPLLIDNADKAVGILKPKVFKGFRGPGNVLPVHFAGSQETLTEDRSWVVRFCTKIGVHVTLYNVDSVKIWMQMTTGLIDREINTPLQESIESLWESFSGGGA